MASEVLSVSHTAGVTNSESVLINGVSGHTYVILGITIVKLLVQLKLLIFIYMMMVAERIMKFFLIKLLVLMKPLNIQVE